MKGATSSILLFSQTLCLRLFQMSVQNQQIFIPSNILNLLVKMSLPYKHRHYYLSFRHSAPKITSSFLFPAVLYFLSTHTQNYLCLLKFSLPKNSSCSSHCLCLIEQSTHTKENCPLLDFIFQLLKKLLLKPTYQLGSHKGFLSCMFIL